MKIIVDNIGQDNFDLLKSLSQFWISVKSLQIVIVKENSAKLLEQFLGYLFVNGIKTVEEISITLSFNDRSSAILCFLHQLEYVVIDSRCLWGFILWRANGCQQTVEDNLSHLVGSYRKPRVYF